MTARAQGTRRGGRRQMQSDRGGGKKHDRALPNPVYTRLKNPYTPIEQFSTDHIEAIHNTSLTILEEIGIKVLNDEAREIFKTSGADVDESTLHVRLDRDMLMAAISTAPREVTLHSRNPARDVTIGGPNVAVATVGGPPNISDMDGGRRPGTLADFANLARLAQSFDVIHALGPMVEPMDLEPSVRHLDSTLAMVTLTEKIPFVYSRGREAVADAVEMIRISRGLTQDALERSPSCFTVVNANSPLQLDVPMSKGVIDFARMGQLMILTPFTLAGAMAPVSLAGALAQQNAEALSGICLAQLTNPGCPVAYGGFTSNVDMKSGAPAFGTPEYVKAAFATGQLARRYGLPWRSSNVNASNAPDVQSAYESQMALWGALMGGAQFIMHGAGWLEGGLTASYEKFIIDVEMLQGFAKLFQPEPCDDGALGLDAIREVGPGGHYFGAAHTLERYETAFHEPLLADWRNYENWQEDGARDATWRANRIYKETLANFEPPALDPGVRQELEEFVAKRKAAGGADLES